MNETIKVNLKELTPELLGDFLDYFDHKAYQDNPGWAKCYCYFYHAPHKMKDWSERTAEENRRASISLVQDNLMHGYLAYVDDQVVGWCNANKRTSYQGMDEATEPDAEQTGCIVCFNILPDYRDHGVATQLLEAACEGLSKQGLAIAEAYPRNDTQDDAANYHGPLAMYLAAGFEKVQELDKFTIVRKRLVESP